MDGFPAKHILDIRSCTNTIGPRSLERHIGLTAGRIYFQRSQSFGGDRSRSFQSWAKVGTLEIDENGEFYLLSCEGRGIVFKHGDSIKIYNSNSSLDYIFIDESD